MGTYGFGTGSKKLTLSGNDTKEHARMSEFLDSSE